MSVAITDVTTTEYLVLDDRRFRVLSPYRESERGLAFAEAQSINRWRAKDPRNRGGEVHVEVLITHTRTEQYAVKEGQ